MKLLLSLMVVAVGTYFTLAGRFFVYRNFGQAFRVILKTEDEEGRGISTFSSLCTHLGATIGTGNILGVAVAIMSGGPGALFWMIFSSLLGMSTKFYENCLAVRCRNVDRQGNPLGGPFCYMQEKLGRFGRVMAWMFAASCLMVGLFGMGTVIQSNSIGVALQQILPTSDSGHKLLASLLISLGITATAALVILGGGRRIAGVSSRLVPIMAVGYVFLCCRILWCCRSELPNAILMVLQSAFGWKAAGCGFAGAVIAKAVSKGIQMGVFSNEAGMGSGPISAGSCLGSDPMEQGFSGAFSVFIDTVVLCTLTGLTLLVTGAWQNGENAVHVTAQAWSMGLSIGQQSAKILLAVFLCVFSFTSILGWNFFAERCAEFLFGNAKITFIYQMLYLLAVFIGPFLAVEMAWAMGETTTWFMLVPNLLALILLRNEAIKVTNEHKKAPS